jgi:4-amino-4-deoxy-L-arabinose transferase-like glycosyltransferase
MTNDRKTRLPEWCKEYCLFFLLLALYLLIILAFAKDSWWGDERRYVRFANNLLQGFYSPTEPANISLKNGPGYPLVLTPFVGLGLPLLAAKIANAFFLFGAILLIYRTLRLYIDPRRARLAAFVLGLYPPFMTYLHVLMSEPFTIFLVSAVCFCFCRSMQSEKKRLFYLVASVLFLTWLMLTKVIFGYVVLAVLIASAVWYAVSRNEVFSKALLICFFALVGCAPYLVYTYALTGHVFYWANTGGANLYWMSTPHPGEFGDWPNSDVRDKEFFRERHSAFFEEADKMPPIEEDQMLRRRALRNIRKHPGKYLRNVIANIGRMLFSYPWSYAQQTLSTYCWAVPNMFLVVTMVFCVYPTWIARKRIPSEIYVLLLLGVMAFFGSSVVSASERHFYVLVPFFGIWVAFVVFKLLEIRVKTGAES